MERQVTELCGKCHSARRAQSKLSNRFDYLYTRAMKYLYCW